MGSELKPCPFCGGEAEEFWKSSAGKMAENSIECKACAATTAIYDNETASRAAWNRRPAAVPAADVAQRFSDIANGRDDAPAADDLARRMPAIREEQQRLERADPSDVNTAVNAVHHANYLVRLLDGLVDAPTAQGERELTFNEWWDRFDPDNSLSLLKPFCHAVWKAGRNE